MLIEMECTYCGHKKEQEVYSQSMPSPCCEKCGDKNLKFRDIGKSKIDYYQGCPPFPEEKKEEKKDDKEKSNPYYWNMRYD